MRITGHTGAAAQGDRLGGVVGHGEPRSALLALYDQHRARGAVPHAHGAPALLHRPPVDARVRRGPPGLPAPLNLGRHLGSRDATGSPRSPRYLTPHPSGRSTRPPGQPPHAHAVPGWPGHLDEPTRRRGSARDNDWVEASTATVWSCRAVVSHRIPEGTSMMYHAQDRHERALSELSGTRGGTDNPSPDLMKPTHLVGLCPPVRLPHYGPTGSQRGGRRGRELRRVLMRVRRRSRW